MATNSDDLLSSENKNDSFIKLKDTLSNIMKVAGGILDLAITSFRKYSDQNEIDSNENILELNCELYHVSANDKSIYLDWEGVSEPKDEVTILIYKKSRRMRKDLCFSFDDPVHDFKLPEKIEISDFFICIKVTSASGQKYSKNIDRIVGETSINIKP